MRFTAWFWKTGFAHREYFCLRRAVCYPGTC